MADRGLEILMAELCLMTTDLADHTADESNKHV
jgi:hypothetical protein